MPDTSTKPATLLNYRMVWRWHFYAGLFTLPFILILCLSGGIYLFKPQIEAWLDRPYDQLNHSGPTAAVSAQVQAALTAFPGSVPAGYELPRAAQASAQVLVRLNGQIIRVYVDPWTLAVLHSVPDDERLMPKLFRLHGELFMGNRGSNLVELAASWTIIMILTGLYLWWPRQTKGLGGILYPRFQQGMTTALRDLHAVIGVWVSLCVLFLLLTGLPWANFWGHYFKAVRQWTGVDVSHQDWTIGSERPESNMSNAGAAMDDHAAHPGNPAHNHHSARPVDLGGFDRVYASIKNLPLDYPVVIAPPGGKSSGAAWSVKSMTQNRPRRVTLTVDGASGEIIRREDFQSRPWIDQVVSTCVAAHEGQLFGWPNQLLGLMTALSLMCLSITGTWMWWRRRQAGVLGAPPAGEKSRRPILLALMVIALAIYLPLFGATVLLVLWLERAVIPRIPRAADWLGLPKNGTRLCG